MIIPKHITEDKHDEFTKAAEGKESFVFEGVQYYTAEGVAARTRARLASAAGTVKGTLKAAHGLALVGKGTFSRNKKTLERGAEKIRQGSIEGKLARVKSIRKSAIASLKATTEDIANDIRKLNVSWEASEGDTSPEELFRDVFKTFLASTEEIFNEIEYEIKQSAK